MTADEEKSQPPAASGNRCREISRVAIRALLNLIDEIAIDGKVDQKAVHRIAKAILADGPLSAAYAHSEQRCTFAFHRAAIECLRHDILGRLIVQPFEQLLDQTGGMERKRLGQFLTAVRMMVGEEDHEVLRKEAADLADAHRGADSFVDWDEFHADPAADLVLEQVLVSIANSFRRFDSRCDWFLVVMNGTPSSISTASKAFVPLKAEDRAKFAFTEVHMANVFDALFTSVRRDSFTSDRLRRFSKRWNASPDKVFGSLFLELARLRQRGS